jgi:hypothetical protein
MSLFIWNYKEKALTLTIRLTRKLILQDIDNFILNVSQPDTCCTQPGNRRPRFRWRQAGIRRTAGKYQANIRRAAGKIATGIGFVLILALKHAPHAPSLLSDRLA